MGFAGGIRPARDQAQSFVLGQHDDISDAELGQALANVRQQCGVSSRSSGSSTFMQSF
jgi:hypothetical protein